MDYISAFNKRIRKFLIEQPQSDSSILIKEIISYFPENKNLYDVFDTYCLRIGLSFSAQWEKTDKLEGYVPVFNFYPQNIFGKQPGNELLLNSNSPIDIESCYSYIAKEIVYLLQKNR